MRENRLKRMFRDGRAAIGASTPFLTPEAVEVMGLLGFDFVFLDGEHGALGLETCQGLVRAAQLTGIEPVVRVHHNDPAEIVRYLETGAWSIVVPHVNSADEARRAVEAVKYRPAGNRGSSPPYTRAAGYGLGPGQAEFFAYANEQALLIPLIEEPAAVEDIDNIVAVPGLEAIFLGSGDLSMALGYPGQHHHPVVVEAMERVLRAARAAGIVVGCLGGADAAANNAAIRQGYGFTLNSGLGLVTEACRAFLSGIER